MKRDADKHKINIRDAASSGWRVLRVPCGVQTHLQFLLICYLIFVSKNRCVSIDILFCSGFYLIYIGLKLSFLMKKRSNQ